MSEDRQWREAKPKWVVDAAKAEMEELITVAALRWPNETRPVPAFKVGGYGRYSEGASDVINDAIDASESDTATFWYVSEHAETMPRKTKVRRPTGLRSNYGRFEATTWDESTVYTNLMQAPYFRTEREAVLYALWIRCESAAKNLKAIWARYQYTK